MQLVRCRSSASWAIEVFHGWFELERARREAPESLKESYDAWDRLLATFRLVYHGCPHPDLNMRAYGGRLFDPSRFPVLEDKRLKISNEVIYQIIWKLTFARGKMGREWIKQRVSYRALDIEQIGSVYEGLMEYKIKKAEDDLIVFKGKNEVIRPAHELLEKSGDDLEKYLKDNTGFAPAKVRKLLEQSQVQPSLLELGQGAPAGHDPTGIAETSSEYKASLASRLEPFKDFIHLDRIIHYGSRYMAHTGSERKGSGSFYTPKQLTSFLVNQALEPLVYKDSEKKEIRSPEEILSIKVCDPAMGSGAFLVQAVRYLGEKLVESWDVLQAKNPGKKLTMPYGKPQNGDLDEHPMEMDRGAP
jgi:type I restriction-modification system DNA methylase subunit